MLKPIERASMLAVLMVFLSALISKVFSISYESIETIVLYTVIIVMLIVIIVGFIEKKRGGK